MARMKNTDGKGSAEKSVSAGKAKDDDAPSDSEEDIDVYDVDTALEKLKEPPAVLHIEDFVNTFQLEGTGVNPHRFKKKEVSEELVGGLFGRRCGSRGRAGYKWQDCTDKTVLARVKQLHPIVYQHDKDCMPSFLKIHFAQGIALEHLEGRGKVNWAAYGQETNQKQRTRWDTQRAKLMLCKQKGVELTKGAFRKVKLEKCAPVGKGGSSKRQDSEVCASRIPTRLEDDMDSRLSERVSHVSDMMKTLAREMVEARASLTPTQIDRDNANQEARSVELFLVGLDGQLRCLSVSSANEEEQEVIDTKQAILRAMKTEQVLQLVKCKRIAEMKEEELQQLKDSLLLKQRQLSAFTEEQTKLQSGSRPSAIQPWPLMYPKPSGSVSDQTCIVVSRCSLCTFEFPQFDVVVASCQHLYHPWCALVVFSKGAKCVEPKCDEIANPIWQKSFGWGWTTEEVADPVVETIIGKESPVRNEGEPSTSRGRAEHNKRTALTSKGKAHADSSPINKFDFRGIGVENISPVIKNSVVCTPTSARVVVEVPPPIPETHGGCTTKTPLNKVFTPTPRLVTNTTLPTPQKVQGFVAPSPRPAPTMQPPPKSPLKKGLPSTTSNPFSYEGLLKGIPNDEPSSSNTTGSATSEEDEDGGSKEEGDTVEELQLPSAGESKLAKSPEGDASVLKLVEHLQADIAHCEPSERLGGSEESMALPNSTPLVKTASTVEHEVSPSDFNLHHLERDGLSSPPQGLAMVDRPKTRSRLRKSDGEQQQNEGIEAPLPAAEAMDVEVQPERRLSGVRRSLSSRDDAPEALVMDVDNTGPEGPKKKVRQMNSLATTPAASGTSKPKTKGSGKKKAVSWLDFTNISKGKEQHAVPVFCAVDGPCPMKEFSYVTKSTFSEQVVIDNGLESRCACTIRNCLLESGVCKCAVKNGGRFAYSEDGRLAYHMLFQKEPEMVWCEPGQGCYAAGLTSRRVMDKEHKACPGHTPRKFIWECNMTCGCHSSCGNRVVQRGMTLKVGVFWTGSKGWGVRTFEAIPMGGFVFEYVGEICSSAELITRHGESHDNGCYTLDLNADWKTEAAVSDANALCVDGCSIGNVGRFVNHRCEDANLADFPVRIERSDPRFYHVAFFAKRNIHALEELTWDYGTAFWEDRGSAPCFCGSQHCRGQRLGANSASARKVNKKVGRKLKKRTGA